MDNDAGTAERVKHFLHRERDWLEQTLLHLDATLAELASLDEYDTVLAAQDARAKALSDFEREQKGLLAEWNDADKSGEETAEVRALAARVRELAAQCAAREDQLREAVEERLTQLESEQSSVSRSRVHTRGYRPLGDTIAGFLDREA